MQVQYKTEPNIFIEIDLMGYYGQENCTLSSFKLVGILRYWPRNMKLMAEQKYHPQLFF